MNSTATVSFVGGYWQAKLPCGDTIRVASIEAAMPQVCPVCKVVFNRLQVTRKQGEAQSQPVRVRC